MISKRKLISYLVMAALLVAINGNIHRPVMAFEATPVDMGRTDNLRLQQSQILPQVLADSINFKPIVYSWTKTWGGISSSSQANNIIVDQAGNIYMAGEFSGTVDFDPLGANPEATFTSHNGTIDAFLSKFNSDGSFLWAKTWGGGPAGGSGPMGRDAANGIALDGSGNVYVSGLFQDTVDFNPDLLIADIQISNAPVGSNNIFLSKFAADGTFQWVKTWGPSDGGAESYNIAIDRSNNVYVVGDFSGSSCDFNPWGTNDVHINHTPVPGSPFGRLYDAFLSKFDSNGNFQWAKTWGGEGYDDGPGVAVDSLDNVYVDGMYASSGPDLNFDPAGGDGGKNHPAHDSGILVDGFLSKFNSNGTFQWVRTWGGQGTDEVGGSLTVDHSDNIYVAGRFGCAPCNFNPDPLGTPDMHSSIGDLDAFVSKFDASGTLQWAKSWGGAGWDAADSVVIDGSENIYIVGIFSNTVDFGSGSGISAQDQWDAYLSELDPTGSFLGVKTWGGPGNDIGTKVTRDASGNIYTAGFFQNSVDFNPGSGVDFHTANGIKDAYVSKYVPAHLVFLPVVQR